MVLLRLGGGVTVPLSSFYPEAAASLTVCVGNSKVKASFKYPLRGCCSHHFVNEFTSFLVHELNHVAAAMHSGPSVAPESLPADST